MTDNEKLIEEAREVVRSWDLKGSWNADSPIGMLARMADALEAAEKARTPTDDEREALGAVIGNVRWSDAVPVIGERAGGMIADAILAAGFRRSVVPEPNADSKQCDYATSRRCVKRAGHDGKHLLPVPPEPQGQPTDATRSVPRPGVLHIKGESGTLCGVQNPSHVTDGPRYADCAECLAALRAAGVGGAR